MAVCSYGKLELKPLAKYRHSLWSTASTTIEKPGPYRLQVQDQRRVKQYRFTVYNRWGEVLFQTEEAGKGRNGEVAGASRESSVFASGS